MAYINPRIIRRREYQREYRKRRRGGVEADGHSALKDAANVRGMTELFAALREVEAAVAIRARRKALQATAQELTKVAKQAVPKFDIDRKAKTILRRAVYRRDPKTIQRYDKGKGRWRKSKPMSYRVSVRVGKAERAGFVDSKGRKRKLGRDAYWWHWIERGTNNRQTQKKGGRGRIEAQNVFRDAFEQNQSRAIASGERAGFAELKKILAKQAAKNRRLKP